MATEATGAAIGAAAVSVASKILARKKQKDADQIEDAYRNVLEDLIINLSERSPLEVKKIEEMLRNGVEKEHKTFICASREGVGIKRKVQLKVSGKNRT
jgi:hypothetical protein